MSHLTKADLDLGLSEARRAPGALVTFLELFLSSPAGRPVSWGCDSAARAVLGLCGCLAVGLCPADY